MKRILVTGGAGFIGSNLCRRLLGDGHKIICLDNLSSGKIENVATLEGDAFEVVEADVETPFFFDVDEIYHLACPASPPYYQRDPVKTMRTNVLGTIHALECAQKAKARILLASTSEIYGDPLVTPQPESYRGNVNSYGPRACYDEGKRAAETLFYDYRTHRGVDGVVVRIFNTYGPFMDPNDGRIVSELIVRGLSGETLKIFGDGTQTRSFCFVDDLVEGLLAAMAKSPGDPINLGNPREVTLNEFIDISNTVLPFSTRVEYGEFREDDPMTRKPDIARAGALLGWEPIVPLEEGLVRTCEYFAR